MVLPPNFSGTPRNALIGGCPAGVPMLAGTGLLSSAEEAVAEAERIGLPVMLKATGGDPAHFCNACFTGNYRVGIEPEVTPQLRLFDG